MRTVALRVPRRPGMTARGRRKSTRVDSFPSLSNDGSVADTKDPPRRVIKRRRCSDMSSTLSSNFHSSREISILYGKVQNIFNISYILFGLRTNFSPIFFSFFSRTFRFCGKKNNKKKYKQKADYSMPPFVASGKRKYGDAGGSSKRYKTSHSTAVVKRPSSKVYRPRQRMGEVKGLDTLLSLNPIINTTGTNGSIFVLNLVPPGSASFNRVGRKIYNKSLRLKGSFTFTTGPTATTSDQLGSYIRMVVVWDKQPSSGSIPTFDSIFGVTAQDGTESTTLLSPLKYDNMDRFQILKDCTYVSNPDVVISGGTTNQNERLMAFDEFLKLGGRETVFSGQSATQTIADISSGGLYVIFRSNANTALTNFQVVNSDAIARLRYTD